MMKRRRVLLFLSAYAVTAFVASASPAEANYRRYPSQACGWSNNTVGHIWFTPSGSEEAWSYSTDLDVACTIIDDSTLHYPDVATLNVHVYGNGSGKECARACVNYPYGIGSSNISCGAYSCTPNGQGAYEYTITVSDLSTAWGASGQDYWFPYIEIQLPATS